MSIHRIAPSLLLQSIRYIHEKGLVTTGEELGRGLGIVGISSYATVNWNWEMKFKKAYAQLDKYRWEKKEGV